MTEKSVSSGGLQLAGIEHLEEIGHGGFASVLRGWQPAFQRWVAVKIVDGSASGRFRKEIRALGSLSEHPHVVPVYEWGVTDDGRPYFVMPLLAGGSLQDRLATGPLEPSQAVDTAVAVADALGAAHRVGILHRDIKPANILYTGYGVPQLADFGVARVDDTTVTGGILAATIGYAAPEVLSGHAASVQSDIYSLGATLYAALRGGAPFESRGSETPVARALRVINDDPLPLETFGVPGPLARTVHRAMAKDPSRRYADAAGLRDALTLVSRLAPESGWGSPVAASRAAQPPTGDADPPEHPRATSPRPPRAGRGPRRVASAAAAAVIMAGAGTALAVSLGRGSSHHTGDHSTAAGARSGTSSAGTVAPGSTSAPASPTSAVGPPTTPAGLQPDTTQVPGPRAGGQPPDAGAAASPAQVPAATLEDDLRSYYSLVDEHQLDQAWTWLSPAFQARIGRAYYQQFWDGISHVQVLSVSASDGSATITLHYVGTNGQSSTESARLGFAVSPDHLVLIDTDQVTRS